MPLRKRALQSSGGRKGHEKSSKRRPSDQKKKRRNKECGEVFAVRKIRKEKKDSRRFCLYDRERKREPGEGVSRAEAFDTFVSTVQYILFLIFCTDK